MFDCSSTGMYIPPVTTCNGMILLPGQANFPVYETNFINTTTSMVIYIVFVFAFVCIVYVHIISIYILLFLIFVHVCVGLSRPNQHTMLYWQPCNYQCIIYMSLSTHCA